jgi:primosomal protein N' (replication factor Y)
VPWLAWLAHYYGASLPETLQTILPSVVSQQGKAKPPTAKQQWGLRLAPAPDPAHLALWHDTLKAKGLTFDTPDRWLEADWLRHSSMTRAQLAKWEKVGVLLREKQRIWRDPLVPFDLPDQPTQAYPPLTPNQTEAVAALLALDAHQPALLQGVTGSGKTEVYMHLIRHTIAQGQQALMLLPEIALTGPIGYRLVQRFGKATTALWHSQLSAGERLDTWQRLRSGEISLLIGARSALFMPLPALGLVICDEAHDASYKQEQPAPRYDARTAALWLAQHQGVRVVFGTATPTVSQYYQAHTTGELALIPLTQRYGQHNLPTVELVDERGGRFDGARSATSQPLGGLAPKGEGQKGLLTPQLTQALHETIDREEQAIILLNRRGFNSQWQCADCGHVFHCPSCSVSLTFHHVGQVLKCHHCGHVEPPPNFCPKCMSTHLHALGTGTQRLHEEVLRTLALPASDVLRLDGDTAQIKAQVFDTLKRFRAGESKVLVGTQLVAKGLDLPNVTLVGVIQAEASLYFPDYTSHERTFQLLTQVAGRAGRGHKPGRVLLQTRDPQHPVIQLAMHHASDAFCTWELEQRESLMLPPYGQLIRWVVSAEERERAEHYATALVRQLTEAVVAGGFASEAWQVLGPAPCPIERLRDRYRFHVQLLHQGGEALRAAAVGLTRRAPRATGLRLLLDVDAQSLM